MYTMYDASKETDKDFLRAALKKVQETNISLVEENRLLTEKLALLSKEDINRKEDLNKLAEELFLLRKDIYDSKAEQRKRARERAAEERERRKEKEKTVYPHNKSECENLEPKDKEESEEKDDDSNNAKDSNPTPPPEEEIEEHTLEDENKCPKCGGESISRINSYEEYQEIDVVEKRYIFKRHKRQKYKCPCSKSIITAPGGAKLVPKAGFSIGFATQVATDKYEHHMPLNRQVKQMFREGLKVGTKTLFGLTEHLYNLLLPLEKMIRQDVLGGKWIHIDESPMPFYNPEKSRGYVWTMGNNRGVHYKFEPNRRGEVAEEMLKGYGEGVVVTDGFSGYGFLDKREGIKHAFCWAHVLRKFTNALSFNEEGREVVDWIDELYDIEGKAKDLESLEVLRKEKSVDIVKKIDEWIDSMEGHYLDTTTLGKAINYYKARRKGLHYFLSDKNVPIDNNSAERRQRSAVMGRKNFLHYKTINGADVGVFLYSIIESCKINKLSPKAYLDEMAYRAAKKEELESPFQYSLRVRRERRERKRQNELKSELGELRANGKP